MPRNANEKRGRMTGGALTAETLASSKSVFAPNRAGKMIGLQQYFTPRGVSSFIARVVGGRHDTIDITAGDGSLLAGFTDGKRYGIEIDADQVAAARESDDTRYAAAQGDIQQLFPLLASANATWPIVVANPPFGLAWDVPGLGAGSSTEMGWRMADGLLAARGLGALICGSDRFRREIAPLMGGKLRALVDVDKMFPGVPLPCCIAFWATWEWEYDRDYGQTPKTAYARVADVAGLDAIADHFSGSVGYVYEHGYENHDRGGKLRACAEEYQRRRGARLREQEHTIELVGDRLSVRPTAYAILMLEQNDRGSYKALLGFNGQSPAYFGLQLKEWRQLLTLRDKGLITIQQAAIDAVDKALAHARLAAVPLYKLPDVQRLGFLADCDSIVCSVDDAERGFVAGQEYPIDCKTAVLHSKGQREKQTLEGPELVDVVIERKAMQIRIGDKQEFTEGKQDLEYILRHFAVPDPGELVTRAPHLVAYWERVLRDVEREIQTREPEFRFRWFQVPDMARLLCKKGGGLGWEQGLGKALAQGAFVRALELAGRLPDGCALFVMPQDLVLQFSQEMHRFFGRDLLRITHAGDDAAHPRARKELEASALEVREMVRARRADLAAQRAGVHLAPRPPVWAVTWFEALAVTGRGEEEAAPVIARRHHVRHEAVAGGYDWRYGHRAARPAWTETKVQTSAAICPACMSDAAGGWDPKRGVCSAKLGKLQNVAYGETQREDDKRDYERVYRPERSSSKRERCGYVHRALKVKPAYAIIGDLFRVACIDEGTKIKGDDSLTSKAARAIRADYRILATGTFVKNFVIDLFWLMWWALGDASARFPYAYKGGRDRFMHDFAVLETRLSDWGGKNWDPEKTRQSPPVEKGARPKMLPEVSNLLRLWKMLCSSVVRRRMDEVGAVLALDGSWKCRPCGAPNQHDVSGGWVKPAVLICSTCSKASDAIVPLTYVPVRVPWAIAQRRFYADWLNKDNFVKHFKMKHPDSPLMGEKEKLIPLMAAGLGQLAKLEYATTDPMGDPDLLRPEILPPGLRLAGLSRWTPGRLKILELAAEHVAKGDKVLIGSSLVAVGPWVSEKLRERGINSVHITDEDAQGKTRTLAPKKRAKAVSDFRSGKSQVLCVGVNAMSLGHNLDVANVVIVDGLPWDFSTWDQFLKRARRLTSKKPVTVYVILPSDSLATEKWARLKDKTAAADLAMDGRLAEQTEQPIDQHALLRELQARGVRFDGTEIPEEQVLKAWYPQGIEESTNAA